MTLTPEKARRIGRVWAEAYGHAEACQAVVDATIEMINQSSTHRVVKAPEGHEFLTDDPGWMIGGGSTHYTFGIRLASKPCPPPDLTPYSVTVQDRYPGGYEIPEGWEAKFETASTLKQKGYTKFIMVSCNPKQVAKAIGHINELGLRAMAECFIGLRKWNG